ncbi:hypothetical protein [Mucilaginibacter boryungensis]|uniref:Uncharacterized protein n=1 Tax=Mucilaginibacter boryungensis TaxID=768480 RepID=A0ABR9XD62_9SPHI|nr:hypothetical protein [Mucilaginibacter boryungensis]MBE9665337.1 hypothetical protein [Mucilaginibacter boryungensis]
MGYLLRTGKKSQKKGVEPGVRYVQARGAAQPELRQHQRQGIKVIVLQRISFQKKAPPAQNGGAFLDG